MSNIFITGTNQIQIALAKELVNTGFDVNVLTNGELSEKTVKAIGAKPVAGSLFNSQTWEGALKAADIVFHSGNFYDPDFGVSEELAVEAIIKHFRGTKKTLVYTSHTWVLGNTKAKADETTKAEPIALVAPLVTYEQKILDLEKTGVRAIVVRPGIVYGYEGDFVQLYARRAAAEKKATFTGSGDNTLNFVALNDLLNLYLQIAQQGAARGIFHAVGNTPVSSRDFAELIASEFGIETLAGLTARELELTYGAFAEALTLSQEVTYARSKEAFDWTPEATNLGAYIKEIKQHHRQLATAATK